MTNPIDVAIKALEEQRNLLVQKQNALNVSIRELHVEISKVDEAIATLKGGENFGFAPLRPPAPGDWNNWELNGLQKPEQKVAPVPSGADDNAKRRLLSDVILDVLEANQGEWLSATEIYDKIGQSVVTTQGSVATTVRRLSIAGAIAVHHKRRRSQMGGRRKTLQQVYHWAGSANAHKLTTSIHSATLRETLKRQPQRRKYYPDIRDYLKTILLESKAPLSLKAITRALAENNITPRPSTVNGHLIEMSKSGEVIKRRIEDSSAVNGFRVLYSLPSSDQADPVAPAAPGHERTAPGNGRPAE